jgi:osmotically inducible protein OsmC
MDGKGEIASVTSGALSNLPVSWKSRTEDPGGATSPEELIAAANAACFAMALSFGLAGAGHAPESLEVSATCTLTLDGGPKIASMDIHVRGKVPGMDQAAFAAAAEGAGQNCPVSTALKQAIEIRTTAQLI